MPLILAIEPDRRQAARVNALARGTINAELIVADSTERGLASLNGRSPDLVLTSLLLSPKDEAGLRELDRAGVPVPTLMIPVLGSSSRGHDDRSGGLLGRMPWSKSAPDVAVSDGCDPKIFAAQILEYLAAEAEERKTDEDDIQVQQVQTFSDVQEVQPVQQVRRALT